MTRIVFDESVPLEWNKAVPLTLKSIIHPFMHHSSLFTHHSSLITLHSSLITLHSSLFILHSSLFTLLLLLSLPSLAQPWYFRFTTDKRVKTPGAVQVMPSDRYGEGVEHGLDFIPSPHKLDSTSPYFFSLRVPDGNYRVTVTLGSRQRAASTTVRAESRRLFVENCATRKGEMKDITFIVNKHSPVIDANSRVRIKPREEKKLNWDDRLTLEINGDAPACAAIRIEPAHDVTTIFLCGNSTVVDQDDEPWASWGQMITRWFGDRVAIANFAESGETASTFISVGRLAKALAMMKKGDYLIAEFGHNDQKQHMPGSGAYYNFATALKTFIDETRQRGATPILATPTQRRAFKDGQLLETHADYPEAMVWVAERERVPLIDLHQMTRTLFETLGEEGSTRALVHYPAGSFPGQDKPFRDNTHFNPYGAYQVAKCVIEGMKLLQLPFLSDLRPDYVPYTPSHPDDIASFHWVNSPFFDAVKPDGN